MRHILPTSAQIKAARALLGWKQSDLAEHSGLSRPSIYNIEAAKHDPRMSTMNKIEAAFHEAGIEFTENSVALNVRMDSS